MLAPRGESSMMGSRGRKQERGVGSGHSQELLSNLGTERRNGVFACELVACSTEPFEDLNYIHLSQHFHYGIALYMILHPTNIIGLKVIKDKNRLHITQ